MSDIDQAALLEIIAGKTRSNTAAAILGNQVDLENAYADALEAEGSAWKENETYLDSIQGKMDQFNNATQTMWNNALDSDVVKWFIDLGTSAVKAIDTLGLIPSLLLAISRISMIKNKMGPIEFFKSLGEMGIKGLRSLQTMVQSWQSSAVGINVVTEATRKLTQAELEKELVDAGLVKSEAEKIVVNTALGKTTNDLTEAQLRSALTEAGYAKEVQDNIVATVLNTKATQDNTKAKTENAGANILDGEAIDKNTGDQLENAAGKKLKDAVGKSSGLSGILSKIMGTEATAGGEAAGFTGLAAAVPIILAVVAAVGLGIAAYQKWGDTVENLSERFKESREEYDEQNDKLTTLKSTLQETKDKIMELQHLPSLTFTQQEELDRLKQQNAELERQIKLQEAILKMQYDQMISDAKAAADATWNGGKLGDKKYAYDIGGNVVEDKWYTVGKDTKAILDEQMGLLKSSIDLKTFWEDKLLNWNEESEWSKDVINENIKYAEEEAIKYQKNIEKIFNDSDIANLTYGSDDDINEILDQYYTYQYKFANITGEMSKSDIISSMFDKTASEDMQNLYERIQKINSDTSKTTEERAAAIQKEIEAAKIANGEYDRLVLTLDELDVTAKDIADYFTIGMGNPELNTIPGKAKEISDAYEKLEDLLKNGNVLDVFDSEGKVTQEKLSEIFIGISEETQKGITKILEGSYDAIKTGTADIESLMDEFGRQGLSQILQIQASNISDQYSTVFKSIKDDIDGLIDTFDELSAALEDTASAMDILDAAQDQMDNSGQISVKTALDLISSTENWADVIDLSTGKITLATGAEDALIQERINLIQASLENARAQAVNALASLDAGKAALYAGGADLANAEAQKNYQHATNQSAAVTAAFGAVIGELASALYNSDTTSWRGIIAGLAQLAKGGAKSALAESFSGAYNEAMIAMEGDTSNQDNSAQIAQLEKQIQDIDAMMGMINQIDTPTGFKNNYDYSTKPGDKYNKGSSGSKDNDTAEDKFKKEMEYWDNRIEANRAKYDQIQNDIDLLEKKGKIAGESYYQNQMKIEKERLSLLNGQKKAATAYLNTFKEGSDELKHSSRLE